MQGIPMRIVVMVLIFVVMAIVIIALYTNFGDIASFWTNATQSEIQKTADQIGSSGGSQINIPIVSG